MKWNWTRLSSEQSRNSILGDLMVHIAVTDFRQPSSIRQQEQLNLKLHIFIYSTRNRPKSYPFFGG